MLDITEYTHVVHVLQLCPPGLGQSFEALFPLEDEDFGSILVSSCLALDETFLKLSGVNVRDRYVATTLLSQGHVRLKANTDIIAEPRCTQNTLPRCTGASHASCACALFAVSSCRNQPVLSSVVASVV